MTTMQSRHLAALDRRTAFVRDPATLVAALDQITATYPDRATRPAQAAAMHDRLAGQLAAAYPEPTKET